MTGKERLARILKKIEDQIELCDPNDKTGGYIVLQREDAEFLRDEIERLRADLRRLQVQWEAAKREAEIEVRGLRAEIKRLRATE